MTLPRRAIFDELRIHRPLGRGSSTNNYSVSNCNIINQFKINLF
ncbi:MAG: hypothetical protein ACTSWR_01570 [Candidatus Helarchaeota archaeon]